MDMTKLNPWNWLKKEEEQEQSMPARTSEVEPHTSNPLKSLHDEVDRLFDSAFRGFNRHSFFGGSDVFKPKVDIVGSEKDYTVTVELPGIDEQDVKIDLMGNNLVIKGEKKQEEKTEEEGYYRVERRYGSFQRVLDLPDDADREGVKASFKNGILTVTMPRLKVEHHEKKSIPIE